MNRTRRPALVALSVAAAVTLLCTSGCAAWRIKQSANLARESVPFDASPTHSLGTLLVVGDSTGVGTGASSPRMSLAGLIASDHPRLKIVNRAKDGAKYSDIAGQLTALRDQHFDAILIFGGGNDVIRFTSNEVLEHAVTRTAQLARKLGNLVVMMPSGNVGNAPFFSAPLSWLMSKRSRDLHKLVRTAAQETGAKYVNLYKEKADDPFAQRSDELNAKDGLHPSDTGYRIWYSELNEQAHLSNWLSSLER